MSMPLDAISASCDADGARWGEFQAPNPLIIPVRDRFVRTMVEAGALRVSVFGSFYRGIHVVNSVQTLETSGRPIAVLTGLCTDGMDAQDAKVSASKRAWKYIPPEERENFMLQCTYMALKRGVPVFTGEVKTNGFTNDILPGIFTPDVILMATFGQKINPDIYTQARLGMYNFHASSISPIDGVAAHEAEANPNAKRLLYPGPNPFDDMLNAGERFTRMAVHLVDDKIDNGAVVGYSPPINIEVEQPENWSRAEHIIALHLRTSMFAAEMASFLLMEIRRTGKPVTSLDFESAFTSHPLWDRQNEQTGTPLKGKPKDYFQHAVIT